MRRDRLLDEGHGLLRLALQEAEPSAEPAEDGALIVEAVVIGDPGAALQQIRRRRDLAALQVDDRERRVREREREIVAEAVREDERGGADVDRAVELAALPVNPAEP